MVFYCENGTRHKVAARLEQLGGEVVDFEFENFGSRSWRVREYREVPLLRPVAAVGT